MNVTTSMESLARRAPLCPHEMNRWTSGYPIRNHRTGTIIGAYGFCPACGGFRRQMFDADPRQYARQDDIDSLHGATDSAEEAA